AIGRGSPSTHATSAWWVSSSAASARSSSGERHGFGPLNLDRREPSLSRSNTASTLSTSPWRRGRTRSGRPWRSFRKRVYMVGWKILLVIGWKSQPSLAHWTLVEPDVFPRPCTIAAALSVLGEKWSLLVVRELALGVHRFGAIARNTGAPRDILTSRLRRL